MTEITLEAIKEKQTQLENMIAAFESYAGESRTIDIQAESIELIQGEHYAGIVLNEDGSPSHHLILLPEEAEKLTWGDAMKLVLDANEDVDLPTRQEQALLYANCKAKFESAWYWSSEQHAADSVVAWCQLFGDGGQDGLDKSTQLRARAVRRLTI